MANNLHFLKSARLTSSASELLVTDCFNRGYDVYQILITKEVRSATGYGELRFLDSSGSELTGGDYDLASLNLYSSSGSTDVKKTAQTYFRDGINYQGTNSADGSAIKLSIYSPDNSSSYTFLSGQASTHYTSQFLTMARTMGVYKQTATVYGIKWYPQSGTINNTKISVYGVK